MFPPSVGDDSLVKALAVPTCAASAQRKSLKLHCSESQAFWGSEGLHSEISVAVACQCLPMA